MLLRTDSNHCHLICIGIEGPDSERRQLFLEWFEIVQDRNSAIRREAELTFK